MFQPANILQAVIFTATGVYTTIGSQLLFNNGITDPRTLLLPLTTYLGHFLMGMIPGLSPSLDSESTNHKNESKSHKLVFLSCALDLSAHILCMAGMSLCGSGLYQVIYSSLVVFTAILSKFVKGKTIIRAQWIGILAVTAGLSLSTLSISEGASIHSSNLSEAEHRRIMVQTTSGCLLSLVGTFVYSLNYIATEHLLTNPQQYGLSGQSLGFLCGGYLSGFLFVYDLMFTIPNWDSWVTQGLIQAQGNPVTCIILIASLIVSALLHSASYYFLMKSLGAISIGVMQGIRAVGVFALSALLFCSQRTHAQCFTVGKAVSTIFVVSGVVIYSYTGNQRDKHSKSNSDV
eukprot:gb/GECH01014991.1/.p1 GENE.gb/GECH01014991.1/~~gb/GECH01014991.1/.p1  ORF type:complete len:347 (+),score=22.07 gb/GECH01014991.1/:1-1041(+)